MVKVLGIDIGTVNLALRGENISKIKITPLIYELINVGSKKLNTEIWKNLSDYLDTLGLEEYDYVLIELQIGYLIGQGSPVNNVKMQVFLESYFLFKHPHIPVHTVAAILKYPRELRGEKAHIRKRWAVERMMEIYEERGDKQSLEVLREAKRVKKGDDLSDASLIILGFFRTRKYLLPRTLETP